MGTQSRKELGRRAWLAFHTMRISLSPPLLRHLNDHSGLSEADYQVFIGIMSVKTRQLKPSELAREIGWDMGRLSHHVTRMEQRGLLDRQPCPFDARSSWIGLTAKGKALADKAIPAQFKEVDRLFSDALTEGQMEALLEISQAIVEHLARLGLPATFDASKHLDSLNAAN